MTNRQYVLAVYPTAKCVKYGGKPKSSMQPVYYILAKGVFPSMIGSPATSAQKAWEFAFNEIKRDTIRKLEQ